MKTKTTTLDLGWCVITSGYREDGIFTKTVFNRRYSRVIFKSMDLGSHTANWWFNDDGYVKIVTSKKDGKTISSKWSSDGKMLSCWEDGNVLIYDRDKMLETVEKEKQKFNEENDQ